MQKKNWRCSKIIVLLLCIFPELYMSRKERFPMSKSFLVYKTNAISGRSCTCSRSFFCSCCESVVILYTKARKQLCVNFNYQMDGLNVNITLDSRVLQNRTITDYKPFKICNPVPGSFFSTICANILELNRFPRSITACLRSEISTKHKLWELTYNCVSLSTELPMMPNATTMTTMAPVTMAGMTTMPPATMAGMTTMPPATMAGMTMMPPATMTGMTMMPPATMTGMTMMPPATMTGMTMMPGMPGMTMMPGMPGMPGMTMMPGMSGMPGMPPGGMPPGGMPPGEMPPGGMPPGGMPPGGMPPGGMPGMSSNAPIIPAL